MPCVLLKLGENIQFLQILLLTIGMVFLIIEIFVPSFGIFGIVGIALLLLTIFLTAKTVAEGIIMFLILLAVATILILVAIRIATKGKLAKKILNLSTFSEEDGFHGIEVDSVAQEEVGFALTVLRPAGKGDFEGKIVDVVTKGEFIAKDTPIVVERIDGLNTIVKEYKEND